MKTFALASIATLLAAISAPCFAESDTDLSVRHCRNSVLTFAARDPLGEQLLADCTPEKAAAHKPAQWACVVQEVGEGRTFYDATRHCFAQ
jgi:hypothetical protein